MSSTMSFSRDGKILTSTSSDDKTIQIWRNDGTLLTPLKGANKIMSVSPDSQVVAVVSAEPVVKIWRRDGTLFKTLLGYSQPVNSATFSPDGKTIASVSDNTVKLSNLDGKLLKTLQGHTNKVNTADCRFMKYSNRC